MPLAFKGIAHPPPQKAGRGFADLSRAEIETTNMGRGAGTDVLMEHDHGNRIGTVHASYRGANGEMRVTGMINDPQAEEAVRTGKMLGLSLGTSIFQTSGSTLMKQQDELSLCAKPRRAGCYIDTVDNKQVRQIATFSAKQSMPPPRYLVY